MPSEQRTTLFSDRGLSSDTSSDDAHGVRALAMELAEGDDVEALLDCCTRE